MKLTDLDNLEIARSYKDAATKTAALPQRLRDEFEQAEAEHREPLPITPLTEVKAAHVLLAIEAIGGKAVSPELADVIGAQRRGCAKLAVADKDVKVYLHSDQLKALLDAAGLGVESAQV